MTYITFRAQRRAAFVEAVAGIFENLQDWYDQYADTKAADNEGNESDEKRWLSGQILTAIRERSLVWSPSAVQEPVRKTTSQTLALRGAARPSDTSSGLFYRARSDQGSESGHHLDLSV